MITSLFKPGGGGRREGGIEEEEVGGGGGGGGKKLHEKSSKCEGGREAGQVVFICLHCANRQKEDSSLLVFTPPILFVTLPALCYILFFLSYLFFSLF